MLLLLTVAGLWLGGDDSATATPAAAPAPAAAVADVFRVGLAGACRLGCSTPCLVEPFCRSSAWLCAKKQMPRAHAPPLRHKRVLYLQGGSSTAAVMVSSMLHFADMCGRERLQLDLPPEAKLNVRCSY